MWYANGQIKQEGNFKNGALKGRMKYWAKDGSVRKISKG
jgi:antitoxin component YwqK of YwqJK toxin-antitoxin module